MYQNKEQSLGRNMGRQFDLKIELINENLEATITFPYD